MMCENIIDLKFFLGLLATLFFAYCSSRFMSFITRKYDKYRAPEGVSQEIWDNAFYSDSSRRPLTCFLGYGEATLCFIAFYFGKPEIIGGWLAFKVASKWQAWSTIIKVPERIRGIDQLVYVGAKNNIATVTLQRWFLGTLANVLAGVCGLILGEVLVRLFLSSHVYTPHLVAQGVGEISSPLKGVWEGMLTMYGLYLVFVIFCFQEVNNKIRHAQDRFRTWCESRKDKLINVKSDSGQVKTINVFEALGINWETGAWLEKDLIFHLFDFKMAIRKVKEKKSESWDEVLKQGCEAAAEDYYEYLYKCLKFKNEHKRHSMFLFCLLIILLFAPTSIDERLIVFLYAILIMATVWAMLHGPEFKFFNNPLRLKWKDLDDAEKKDVKALEKLIREI